RNSKLETRRAQDNPISWRFLMERPSEYRGRLVVVEGFVQSSQAYELQPAGEPALGRVLQTELGDPITRGLCTIISVADQPPVPLRARVRAKGYFLKVRRFKTRAGDISDAPLLVA